MNQNKFNEPFARQGEAGTELSDDPLDEVSGGVYRPRTGNNGTCKHCGGSIPTNDPYGGYCSTCYNDLKKQGFTPIL